MSRSGHLFVVRGRVESVLHDAAVIPTDDQFRVEPRWQPVHGAHAVKELRPGHWPGRGWARAADGRPQWFLSVGAGDRTGADDDEALPAEELLDRLRAVVDEVGRAHLPPSTGRTAPVLAVPVLGLEGGGHGAHRGGMVKALLSTLAAALDGLDLDVAVVTPEPSVYAAAQHVRATEPAPALTDNALAVAERLGGLARRGDLALFLGAGVSIPAGLPSWQAMLDLLARRSGALDGVQLDRLTSLDQAELVSRRLPDLGEQVAAICRQHERPSLAHALLAALNCHEAVTTNYDRLYEVAVVASGRARPRVLPWESPVGADSWVLKMHGDVHSPSSIVLTRRDVVRFDARTRPTGSLLQSLLLTRHLLVVGASMADDNVVRLLREVQVYREDHGLDGPVGTLLDVDDDEARSELWRDQLEWLTLPGDSSEERVRALEVFLDTVARYAADDTPWLLDRRFLGLLDGSGLALADQARRLRRHLDAAGPEWSRLATVLDDLGAAET